MAFCVVDRSASPCLRRLPLAHRGASHYRPFVLSQDSGPPGREFAALEPPAAGVLHTPSSERSARVSCWRPQGDKLPKHGRRGLVGRPMGSPRQVVRALDVPTRPLLQAPFRVPEGQKDRVPPDHNREQTTRKPASLLWLSGRLVKCAQQRRSYSALNQEPPRNEQALDSAPPLGIDGRRTEQNAPRCVPDKTCVGRGETAPFPSPSGGPKGHERLRGNDHGGRNVCADQQSVSREIRATKAEDLCGPRVTSH